MYSVPQDIQDMILYAYQHQEGVIRSSQHACVCVRVFACVCVYVCLFVCVCVCVCLGVCGQDFNSGGSMINTPTIGVPPHWCRSADCGASARACGGPILAELSGKTATESTRVVCHGWILLYCYLMLGQSVIKCLMFSVRKTMCLHVCNLYVCVCVCVYLCVWYCSNVILIKGRFLDILCPCLRNDNPKAFPSALHHVGHLFSASHLSLNMYNEITTR